MDTRSQVTQENQLKNKPYIYICKRMYKKAFNYIRRKLYLSKKIAFLTKLSLYRDYSQSLNKIIKQSLLKKDTFQYDTYCKLLDEGAKILYMRNKLFQKYIRFRQNILINQDSSEEDQEGIQEGVKDIKISYEIDIFWVHIIDFYCHSALMYKLFEKYQYFWEFINVARTLCEQIQQLTMNPEILSKIILVYLHIGVFYNEMQNYEKSNFYYEQSLKIATNELLVRIGYQNRQILISKKKKYKYTKCTRTIISILMNLMSNYQKMYQIRRGLEVREFARWFILNYHVAKHDQIIKSFEKVYDQTLIKFEKEKIIFEQLQKQIFPYFQFFIYAQQSKQDQHNSFLEQINNKFYILFQHKKFNQQAHLLVADNSNQLQTQPNKPINDKSSQLQKPKEQKQEIFQKKKEQMIQMKKSKNMDTLDDFIDQSILFTDNQYDHFMDNQLQYPKKAPLKKKSALLQDKKNIKYFPQENFNFRSKNNNPKSSINKVKSYSAVNYQKSDQRRQIKTIINKGIVPFFQDYICKNQSLHKFKCYSQIKKSMQNEDRQDNKFRQQVRFSRKMLGLNKRQDYKRRGKLYKRSHLLKMELQNKVVIQKENRINIEQVNFKEKLRKEKKGQYKGKEVLQKSYSSILRKLLFQKRQSLGLQKVYQHYLKISNEEHLQRNTLYSNKNRSRRPSLQIRVQKVTQKGKQQQRFVGYEQIQKKNRKRTLKKISKLVLNEMQQEMEQVRKRKQIVQ